MRPYTVLLAASGWIALAATGLPALSIPRVLLTLLFVAAVPGIAVLRMVAAHRPAGEKTYEPLLASTLAVSVSLALATLVSESLILTGTFTMTRCVIVLAALTSVLCLAPAALSRRRISAARAALGRCSSSRWIRSLGADAGSRRRA